MNNVEYEKQEGEMPAKAPAVRVHFPLHPNCFADRPNIQYPQTLFEYRSGAMRAFLFG
jgi:hypothetical protein